MSCFSRCLHWGWSLGLRSEYSRTTLFTDKPWLWKRVRGMQALQNSTAFPMALRDPWPVLSVRCFLAAMRTLPKPPLHSTALNQKDTGFQHRLPNPWARSSLRLLPKRSTVTQSACPSLVIQEDLGRPAVKRPVFLNLEIQNELHNTLRNS